MHGLIKPTSDNSSPNLRHRIATFVFILTLGVVSFLPGKQAQSADKDRTPNIVVIFMDDK